MSNEINPPKKRGCLFYGCLSVAILALLMIALGIAAYFFGMSTANGWIRDYTDTAPAEIEKVEYTRDQMEALQARLAVFQEAMDAGTNVLELALTADDLNALIKGERRWKDKVFIRLDDNKINGEVSMPLQDFGPFKMNGRYLNGTASFKVALHNGVLDVRLLDVQAKGQALPSMVLNELKKNNLAQDFQNDPQTAANIAKFETIQITNSTVILWNKVKGQ